MKGLDLSRPMVDYNKMNGKFQTFAETVGSGLIGLETYPVKGNGINPLNYYLWSAIDIVVYKTMIFYYCSWTVFMVLNDFLQLFYFNKFFDYTYLISRFICYLQFYFIRITEKKHSISEYLEKEA